MTSVAFNPFSVRRNCSVLQQHEQLIKKKISGFNSEGNAYNVRIIRAWMAFAFVIMLPLCVIQMTMLARKRGFFLDVVKNDLSRKIFSSYDNMHWLDRFTGELGKLFLQPLRIYSHTSRDEWCYPNKLLAWLVKYSCFCYITIFYLIFKKKKFFIREDFYAASSCLASIRELWGGPDLISFQHGSMSLERIEKYQVYPGQRARLQVVNDEDTLKLFRNLTLDQKCIIGPVRNYYPIEFCGVECREILFIGNGSASVRNKILKIIKIISVDAEKSDFKISYKPHPSEVFELDPHDNFLVMGNSDEDQVLGDHKPKIFIGVTSTVLYDAIIMGQKVLFIKDVNSKILDSVQLLSEITYIDNEEKSWEIIINELNIKSSIKNVFWDIDESVDIILSQINLVN